MTFVVVAWFSQSRQTDGVRELYRARVADALSGLVPPSYRAFEVGGDDWGLCVRHVGHDAAYRWPVVAVTGETTAISLGIPVGGIVAAGPVGLAADLLDGHDMPAGVLPPFGLLAMDGARRLAIAQDWLGMCRLFTGESDGVTVFASRPSLVAELLHGVAVPDMDGWASYAICGHFGGDLSPIRGGRLLAPGERVEGCRRDDGGWSLVSTKGRGVDDVVLAGLASSDAVDDVLDRAAASFRRTAEQVHEVYAGELSLGLSGGKDSRLLAASFVSSGRVPTFITNEDTAAEGETARRLVAILEDSRHIRVDHRLVTSGAPAAVLQIGLRERVTRLQRQYDHQFPSTFAVRPAEPTHLPERPRNATVSGAGGELATGYWYPASGEADFHRAELLAAASRHLHSAAPISVLAPPVVEQERQRLEQIVAHALDLGLHGNEVLDYVYLVERVRRWYTSAYHVGMVTPFLAPDVVSATFALSSQDKRDRRLHRGLLGRFVPEWADVPYVSVATGGSTAAQVWDGDGLEALADLVDTANGDLPRLMTRAGVEAALAAAVRGPGKMTGKTLQQFASLAIAASTLERVEARPSTGRTYARVTAAPRHRSAPPPGWLASGTRCARFANPGAADGSGAWPCERWASRGGGRDDAGGDRRDVGGTVPAGVPPETTTASGPINDTSRCL